MWLDNKDLNKLFFLASSLSIAGTSLVIGTYLKFPKLRQYRHVELTFYIAVNDLLAAIAVGVGKARNESFACWFQSIGTSYAFLASVFWSAVVTYQIYVIVHRGRILDDLTNYHRFCWLFPLLVVILPFTTNSYGVATSSWCFLGDRKDSPEEAIYVWILLSFFVWLWMAIVFIVFVFGLIIVRVRDVETVEAMTAYRPLYRLASVPIVLIFCWTLPSFLVLYGAIMEESYWGPGTAEIHTLSAVLPPLQGALMSLSFFIVNKSARDEWRNHISSFLWNKPASKTAEFEPSRTSLGSTSFISMSESESVSGLQTADYSNSMSHISAMHLDHSTGASGKGSGGSMSTVVRPTGDNAWLSRAASSKQSTRSLASAANNGNGSSNVSPNNSAGTNASYAAAYNSNFNTNAANAPLNSNFAMVTADVLRSNLQERDSMFERGSDSYWTSPAVSTNTTNYPFNGNSINPNGSFSYNVNSSNLRTSTSNTDLNAELNRNSDL
jgi:hypothetical protein